VGRGRAARALFFFASRFDRGRSSSPSLSPLRRKNQHNTQDGIDKLVRLLENDNEAQFNAEQYMQLYT
jgi:hypothetical protein